jgi:hypothetical protein
MAASAGNLRLRPISLRAANRFVALHGGCGWVRSHKFALAFEDLEGRVRGVVIAGRPVARWMDTGWRLEVLRLATDGAPELGPALYAAVARAGIAIGYRPEDILTHTRTNEPSGGLRAAGWVRVGSTDDGVTRHRGGRLCGDERLTGGIRWHAELPTNVGSPLVPDLAERIYGHRRSRPVTWQRPLQREPEPAEGQVADGAGGTV